MKKKFVDKKKKSDKGLKGTVVNQRWHSTHGGLLKINAYCPFNHGIIDQLLMSRKEGPFIFLIEETLAAA